MTYPDRDSTLFQGEGIPPISVRVENLPDQTDSKRKTYRGRGYTFTLAAGGTPTLIANYDTQRECLWIYTDGIIFIGGQNELTTDQPANNPGLGMRIPANALPFPVRGNDAIYAVQSGAGPAHIGVWIEHCLDT